jgi:hypothetical protein
MFRQALNRLFLSCDLFLHIPLCIFRCVVPDGTTRYGYSGHLRGWLASIFRNQVVRSQERVLWPDEQLQLSPDPRTCHRPGKCSSKSSLKQ